MLVVPIPAGKAHPILSGWEKLRLTEKEIHKYFHTASGIGVLLAPSGLVDVDCDCSEAVTAAGILLPRTSMVHGHSSNPKSHYYYRCSAAALQNTTFKDPRRPEQRADSERATLVELRVHGQTLIPPSVNLRTGEPVKWDFDGEPATIDGADLARGIRRVAAAALMARCWPPNSRHFASLATAGMLLRAGWSREACKCFVLAVATAARDEEVASRLRNISSTSQRVAKDQPVTGATKLAELIGAEIVCRVLTWLELPRFNEDEPSAQTPHNTDLGNAQRFVTRHGQNLRFCPKLNQWFVFDETRWVPDETGEVVRRAKETVRAVYSEAATLTERATREELAKHALRSEGEKQIRSMVNLAKSEERIAVTPDQFDTNPWFLNCRNGTLDLRTGKLFPHQRNFLCSKSLSVPYEPDAKCPQWLAFIRRIMSGDLPSIEFLQRAIGYGLTGKTSEQVLFVLYGRGANGKTTFIETVRKMLGDYARQSAFDSFVVRRNEGPRNDLARLTGARFVAAVETGEGRRLDETVIKQLTGGDTLAVRYLYREPFEFVPQLKLWLVANHKPSVKGTDEAIWRRIRLIPFDVTIPPTERDKLLPEKLQSELPGILAWCVRGCFEWQRAGLREPVRILKAGNVYRREMDILGEFIEDNFIFGPREYATSADIYDAASDWCIRNNEPCVSMRSLSESLRERGYKPRKEKGKRGWLGLRLVSSK